MQAELKVLSTDVDQRAEGAQNAQSEAMHSCAAKREPQAANTKGRSPVHSKVAHHFRSTEASDEEATASSSASHSGSSANKHTSGISMRLDHDSDMSPTCSPLPGPLSTGQQTTGTEHAEHSLSSPGSSGKKASSSSSRIRHWPDSPKPTHADKAEHRRHGAADSKCQGAEGLNADAIERLKQIQGSGMFGSESCRALELLMHAADAMQSQQWQRAVSMGCWLNGQPPAVCTCRYLHHVQFAKSAAPHISIACSGSFLNDWLMNQRQCCACCRLISS